MFRYKCIIVEDEPLAVGILEDYIREVPFLELKAVCPDAIKALQVLQEQAIDLVFLDIHLPKLKGLDFLRTLKHPPKVILTTAYHQYALESYEYGVVDYLLKPIEFTRFLQAVNKVRDERTAPIKAAESDGEERPYFFCTVNKKRVKVFTDEILYIESQKEYSKIVTAAQTVLTKLPHEQIEAFVAAGWLVRVHRSFLVAAAKITAYSATEIEIGNTVIPIGRSYKELVQAVLERLNRK